MARVRFRQLWTPYKSQFRAELRRRSFVWRHVSSFSGLTSLFFCKKKNELKRSEKMIITSFKIDKETRRQKTTMTSFALKTVMTLQRRSSVEVWKSSSWSSMRITDLRITERGVKQASLCQRGIHSEKTRYVPLLLYRVLQLLLAVCTFLKRNVHVM